MEVELHSYDEDSDTLVKTSKRLVTSAIANAVQLIIMEARAVSGRRTLKEHKLVGECHSDIISGLFGLHNRIYFILVILMQYSISCMWCSNRLSIRLLSAWVFNCLWFVCM